MRAAEQLAWGRRALDVSVVREESDGAAEGAGGEAGDEAAQAGERVTIAIRYTAELARADTADPARADPCPCRPGLWCVSFGW